MRVANAACLTLPEENILLYIAGYLLEEIVQEAYAWYLSAIFGSELCVWSYKQIVLFHLYQALTYPSTSPVNFTNALEKELRTSFSCVMHFSFVHSGLVKTTSRRVEDITCGNVKCQSAQSYLISLFMTVRIHNVLREQNRSFGISGRRCNRKIVKLFQMWKVTMHITIMLRKRNRCLTFGNDT